MAPIEDEVEVELVEVFDVELEDALEDALEGDDAELPLVQPRQPRNAPPPLRIEGLAQLEKECSSWRAAGIAAWSLAKAVRARIVLVHSIDGRRDELRTIGVNGPRSHALLGCCASAGDDFIASAVITNGRPMTLRFEDGELPRFAPERFAVVAAARSVTIVPIMCGPHCIGMIEVVDASEELSGRVEEACAKVIEHLAVLF